MAMLCYLAFVFALALNGHPAQPPQPQAHVTSEVPQVSDPHTEHPPDNTKPSESYWRKAIKPDILPVWIGGVAALLASIAGLLTLKNLKEQARVGLIAAKAGEEGAKAALLNAKAVINAERPWLVVGFKETNDTTTGALPTYAFTFINQGKTPAIVKKISIGHSVVTSPYDLPIHMREEDLSPRDLPDLTLIVSKDSFTTWPEVDPEGLLESYRKTTQGGLSGKLLMIYGMIEYHDVFESWGPGRKPHRTKWSYGYDTRTGNLISVGPDEYNSHT